MRATVYFVMLTLALISHPVVANVDGGVAVVELFTSEGCSSCPAADRQLSALAQKAQANHEAIYVLAFHVDYWNRLGWTDRFSQADFTQRQNDYAQRLKLGSLYTPQMIVNGTSEFVGSDRGAAEKHIADALRQMPPVRVTAAASHTAGDKLRIEFDTTSASAADLVNVAVVEDGLSTAVRRGENAGRQLQHDGVVRSFTTRPVAVGGRDSLETEVGQADIKKLRVIVYVQDAKTFAVRGAAMVQPRQ